MIRWALLLAVGTTQSACSAGEVADDASGGNQTIPTARPEAGGATRELDGRTGQSMSETQIVIKSERGQVTAELVDNEATRALVRMLPLTIEMRDHLRQEKTGDLPSPLPELPRQLEFSEGTLGLWGNSDLVIYYRNGRVPKPGIILLGRVRGNLSIFDHPEPVEVQIELVEP